MTLNIPDLTAHPEKLTDKAVLHELQELIATYPYYSTLRLLYLKGLYLSHAPKFGQELQRTALYTPDRRVLFHLIEGEYYTLKPVPRTTPEEETLPDGAKPDRTLTLIDAFLNSLPDGGESQAVPLSVEEELSSGYTSYVLREEDLDNTSPARPESPSDAPMKGQTLIDNFIRNSDKEEERTSGSPALDSGNPDMEKLPSIEEDDGYFTETLAKIYIKQHRYSKALEIIRRLSLKYPKKNAYFADQIRFLERLLEHSTDK